MNVTLYNAAMTALRASALESLALLELYVKTPTAVPDHSSVVEEVKKHARSLAENEAAARALQQYFQPQQPQASATPRPPSRPITEEELMQRSPTFRKSPAGKAREDKQKETQPSEEDNGG